VIVSDNATAEGSYVGITRARERTDLYAGIDPAQRSGSSDRLEMLADRMSGTEPEAPSIDVPLRHEAAVTRQPERSDPEMSHPPMAFRGPQILIEPVQPAAEPSSPELALDTTRSHERTISSEAAVAQHRPESDARSEALEANHEAERAEVSHSWSWEP
jgi:hypothetical protein